MGRFSSSCVCHAGGHIPYRDSKLTRILQPSLGGNAKTAIICNITPAVIHADESHSTLRFACRAKRVVNNAVVNEVLSDAAVLKRQAHEIEELRKMLTGSGYVNSPSVAKQPTSGMQCTLVGIGLVLLSKGITADTSPAPTASFQPIAKLRAFLCMGWVMHIMFLHDSIVLPPACSSIQKPMLACWACACRNAEIEAQIAHLRAELLHKEQENDRVQLQLTQEKEERERAQRKVTASPLYSLHRHPNSICKGVSEAMASATDQSAALQASVSAFASPTFAMTVQHMEVPYAAQLHMSACCKADSSLFARCAVGCKSLQLPLALKAGFPG